ncbi:hypothetical protein PRK78_005452 [Emydomyces testavorans]|uniref:Aminoglycoside phosphotransferase domain-containing protein n=1 Tax=Emydomyces testavorans TaxID=2070801 RepID=A0AAF0DJN7_9EURO|nr:hypothetical protein PRK78_005452 [Emydomyces testavorans]
MTLNHANYQARLDFIQNLLHKQFNLKEDADITPIQYDPSSPFKYNNFVYRISLPSPITAAQALHNGPRQPGCVAIPHGTQEFIFRLANPDAEGMHPATRIENEVAIISLAAAALDGFVPHVVPSVYAWGSAATGRAPGWILQELMPGTPLDDAFRGMDLPQKKNIFAQQAALLKALQDYQLPDSITGFGGVTFDDAGRIVSAAMPTVGVGPWPSYEASFKGRLEVALKRADANPYIRGWRANGVRERLDAFVEHGVPAQFESLSSKQEKAIVHADFSKFYLLYLDAHVPSNPQPPTLTFNSTITTYTATNNLLFDPPSQRLTALIDYDFACILHPSHEFLRSFDGAGGQLRGWSDDAASQALTEAKLHGFPSPLPQPPTQDGVVQWDVAHAWEDALEKGDVKRRPRTIAGIDKVADVDAVLRAILPWRLSNSDILRIQSEEVILKCRCESEERLVRMLGRLGV